MKKANAGFTLIELVVVIVILGILAAVAVPKFFDLSGEAEVAAAQGVAGAIASGSSVNFAARKVGKTTGTVQLNQANVCTADILGSLMQGGVPEGFTIGGTGNCSGETTESVTCTVTKGNATAQNATVMCAR